MNPLVSIAIVTYNHEKFIKQAIESVLRQSTTFDFNIIIGDDCSTDSTFKICQNYVTRYPDKIILLKNEINQGLVRNYKNVFDHCKGKYIAILEGDDYWIDDKKLQKQINVLESNKSIGIVHTDNDVITHSGKIIKSYKKSRNIKPVNNYAFEALLKRNFITSNTVVFRKEIFTKFVDFSKFIEYELVTIDYSLWLEISYHSQVFYIDESTSMYRKTLNSLTNNRSFNKLENYFNKGRLIKKYHIEKYQPKNYTSKKIDFEYDLGLLKWSIILNEHKKACEYVDIIKENSNLFKILSVFIKNKLFFKILVTLFNSRFKIIFRLVT